MSPTLKSQFLHPVEEPKLANIGVNQFLSPDADFSTARLNKIRGAGKVTIKDKSAAGITIIIDDPGPTMDTYEFDVTID